MQEQQPRYTHAPTECEPIRNRMERSEATESHHGTTLTQIHTEAEYRNTKRRGLHENSMKEKIRYGEVVTYLPLLRQCQGCAGFLPRPKSTLLQFGVTCLPELSKPFERWSDDRISDYDARVTGRIRSCMSRNRQSCAHD